MGPLSSKLKIGFLSLIFIMQSAFATVYHIDALNGNDNNKGTSEKEAWKTLSKVVSMRSHFNAGDVIAFKRGQTFYGPAYFNDLHGERNRPIVFTSYGEGSKPIITVLKRLKSPSWNYHGNNKWSTPLRAQTARLWKNGKEQKVTSLPRFGHTWNEFGGKEGAVWIWDNNKLYYYSSTKPEGVFEVQGSAYALRFDNSSYIKIENLAIEGGSSAALQLKNCSFIEVSFCQIGRKASYGISVSNLNNFKIHHNVIDSAFTLDYSAFTGSYKQIDGRGCYDGFAIWGSARDGEIYNNNFIDWGHTALQFQPFSPTEVTRLNIHHNFITAKDLGYGRAFGYSGGAHHNEIHHNYIKDIKVQNQCDGTYNHFHHNWIDGVSDTTLKRGQEGHAIVLAPWYENDHHNIFEYNTIKNVDGAGIFLEGSNNASDDTSRNVFRNNLFQNCGRKEEGFAIIIDRYQDVRGNDFFHNAILSSNSEKIIKYRGKRMTLEEFERMNGANGDQISGNILKDPGDGSVGAGPLDLSVIGVDATEIIVSDQISNSSEDNEIASNEQKSSGPFIMDVYSKKLK